MKISWLFVIMAERGILVEGYDSPNSLLQDEQRESQSLRQIAHIGVLGYSTK
jgi:hypothetical protein